MATPAFPRVSSLPLSVFRDFSPGTEKCSLGRSFASCPLAVPGRLLRPPHSTCHSESSEESISASAFAQRRPSS